MQSGQYQRVGRLQLAAAVQPQVLAGVLLLAYIVELKMAWCHSFITAEHDIEPCRTNE